MNQPPSQNQLQNQLESQAAPAKTPLTTPVPAKTPLKLPVSTQTPTETTVKTTVAAKTMVKTVATAETMAKTAEIAQAQGQCPRCGQPNAYTTPVCDACGGRLPWADAIDEARRESVKAQAEALAAAQQQAAEAEAARKQAEQTRDLGIYSSSNSADGPSFVAAFIGLVFPIGGALIYLLQKEEFPERAGSAGKGALVGLFVGIALSLAFWLGLFSYGLNYQ